MNTYTATGTVASVSGSVTSVWPFAQMLNVVSISSVSDCAVPVSTSLCSRTAPMPTPMTDATYAKTKIPAISDTRHCALLMPKLRSIAVRFFCLTIKK